MQVGQRVYCCLYGGKTGVIVAIHGTPSPETCKTMFNGVAVMGGNAHVDVIWDNGTESRRLSEALVRGSVQWKLYDEIWNEAQIEEAKKRLEDETRRRTLAAEAAKQKFDAECAELIKKYPNLTLKDVESYDTKRAVGNIRKMLKATWPKVKFSVRKDTSAVRISWTDGPTEKQVEAIANRFEAGSFNGMEDIYECKSTPWNTLFGSIDYVFTTRESSVAAVQKGIDVLWEILPNVRELEKPTYTESSNYLWDSYQAVPHLHDTTVPALVKTLIAHYDWTQNTWVSKEYGRYSFIVDSAIKHFAQQS